MFSLVVGMSSRAVGQRQDQGRCRERGREYIHVWGKQINMYIHCMCVGT